MTLQLSATTRTASKTERTKLRTSDLIPAVVYGHGIANQNVAVTRATFEKVYQQAGESTLVDLVVEKGGAVPVLIQAVDRHPTSGLPLHVDFYQVRMDEAITNDVPLVYTGESKAMKELGGILVKNADTLKVKCLPKDLPSELHVDISALVDFTSRIAVADIATPPGVEVLAKSDEIIAIVEPPRSEEELKALDEKVQENVETVEKVEQKKPAEDEGDEETKKEAKPA